jgi:sterol desaturase/sphingolipid hydroxylase (fatty acid hydroxylase superfamily)
MELSKTSYYSDYFAYPVIVAGLAVAGLHGARWQDVAAWGASAFAGVLLWTFMEYVLHRVALHRIALFVPLHGLHHAAPLAYVGTPTWLSVSILGAGLFAPVWWLAGLCVASGLTSGVMVGYMIYGLVHHVIHHRRHSPTSKYFNELRTWHMRHHYSPRSGNFGVTTPLWDYVFGTAITTKSAKSG